MDSDNLLSNLMLFAGLALVAMVLMRRLYNRSRGRRTGGEAPRPPRHVSQPLIDAPAELARWQVDMHEVARELRAELDTKAVLVQSLIGMLREEIDRLEAVADRCTAARRERPDPVDGDLLEEIKRLAGEIAADAPLTTSCQQGLAAPAAGHLIGSLADRGRSAAEIARLLSLPVGEVELALSVRHGKAREASHCRLDY